MTFKDHFSQQSLYYARYRPGYPEDLYACLASLLPARECAWDCATGTGQAAIGLSRHFDQVVATDASRRQIANAKQAANIDYRTARAEDSGLDDCSVDLITVAQALHWFNLEDFFREAARVLRPGGILAVWTYALMKVTPDIDDVITRFYSEILGQYWPPERAMVDRRYEGIGWPFASLHSPELEMSTEWDREHFYGYLMSWSAVQKFQTVNHRNPLDLVRGDLDCAWGEAAAKKKITWPLTLKIGRKGT